MERTRKRNSVGRVLNKRDGFWKNRWNKLRHLFGTAISEKIWNQEPQLTPRQEAMIDSAVECGVQCQLEILEFEGETQYVVSCFFDEMSQVSTSDDNESTVSGLSASKVDIAVASEPSSARQEEQISEVCVRTREEELKEEIA